MTPPLAYWSSGGDLIAGRGLRMTPADAQALWELHLDEAYAAALAGDRSGQAMASRLAVQLKRAVRAQTRWRQASGQAIR